MRKPRGIITEFTAEARKRLRLSLMSVDWTAVDSYWVCLTYHRRWGEDWREWKRDLHAFKRALDRHYPVVGGYWRLEMQRRGAPHFHLILCYSPGEAPRQDVFRVWVAETWARVIGEQGNAAHRAFGTLTVRADRNSDGDMGAMVSYLAGSRGLGEVTKGRQDMESVDGSGRHWGHWGHLPVTEIATVELTNEGYGEFARRVAATGRGWLADNLSGAWQGFVMIGSGRRMYAELLDDLPGGVRIVSGFGSEGSSEESVAPQAQWRR